MAHLLGVDFGTTSIKACLFNEQGERLKTASCKYELITKGDYIEFPAQEFFNVFLKVYTEIAKDFKIDAISVDTQGETLIVLDREGSPLCNAIIWLDNRAVKEAKAFEDEFGLEKIYNLTGQAEVISGYPLPKVKWLKDNMPSVFDKADKFLLLEDYILYKLTGKFVASRSLYSSSLFMNVHTGEYIKEFLDYVGITQDNLPILCESGTPIGEYNGAVVSTSALDQIAGAIGAGVTKEGVVSETTGTALAVTVAVKEFPKYYNGLKVSAYYMKKGLYCLLMWSPTAGATLEWFKKNFAGEIGFDKLNELASKVPAGSEGLICIPHLAGVAMPENNPLVKGCFFGIELKHTLAHFIRSIMEAVSYNVKEFLEYLNVDVSEIRCMGGGANSELWCKIKSGVLDKKIVTLCENETACLGSAIFAGVGLKIYQSAETACDRLVQAKKEYSAKENSYGALYKAYKETEKKIINIY